MEKDKFTIKDLDLFYGDFQALKKISMAYPGKRDYCIYRTFRMRKIHIAKVLKPNE